MSLNLNLWDEHTNNAGVLLHLKKYRIDQQNANKLG